jgi:para-nitrobenzyl esterase
MRAMTTGGAVEGLDRDGIWQFRDIPYAGSTAGDGRFRPPQPVEPWHGVRDCTQRGPIAPQNPSPLESMLGADERPRSEDCLSLTVSTPGPDGARPVMVWIHGGGFNAGAGSIPWYDGTNLARRGDVVVVAINYRLGALGFSHLEGLLGSEFAGSGNVGLLDQIAALAWVRDNIEAFGGDPGQVTVFGESAGAMSVATLMGTPAAAGLFHRAIAQSGACRNVSAPDHAAEVVASMLHALGTKDASILLEATMEELLAAQQVAHDAHQRAMTLDLRLPFQPVVDGTVLPVPPLAAIAEGSAAGVPLLAGTTAEEWALFHLAARGQGPMDEDDLVRRVARLLDPVRGAGAGAEAVHTYRTGRPDASPDDLWVAMATDIVFRVPEVRLHDAHHPHAPGTWSYRFGFRSPAFGGLLGACHAVEIPFVFDVLDRRGVAGFLGEIGPAERELAAVTSTAWLAFARSGEPGHEGLPPWPAHDDRRRPVMELAHRRHLLEDPHAAEREVWTGII